jgi:acyl-coenzyme A synthetase/AMP-(fatty) acid ligase
MIFVSIETGVERTYTYRELHREVVSMAAGLQALGVAQGDRVLLYMPMIPEAVFAMLACARLGAIHSVVFGDLPVALWPVASKMHSPRSSSVLTQACVVANESHTSHCLMKRFD